jgi:hypothetical protein
MWLGNNGKQQSYRPSLKQKSEKQFSDRNIANTVQGSSIAIHSLHSLQTSAEDSQMAFHVQQDQAGCNAHHSVNVSVSLDSTDASANQDQPLLQKCVLLSRAHQMPSELTHLTRWHSKDRNL